VFFVNVVHSLDAWHKSKKIAHSLETVEKRQRGKDIIPWIKPIVNHFLWCPANCDNNKERIRTTWTSMLPHICNIHQSPLYTCPHGALTVPEGQKMVDDRFSCLHHYTVSNLTQGIFTSRVENFNIPHSFTLLS